jgi:hypothetical protein
MDNTKKVSMITVFGPMPSEPLTTIGGQRYVHVDGQHNSLYSEAVLRKACRFFARGVDLIDWGGVHAMEAAALSPRTIGSVRDVIWDASSFSLVGIAYLNNSGKRLIEADIESGLPTLLSWDAVVKWQWPALPSGKQIVREIVAVRSVDVHHEPLTGARFGRLPVRQKIAVKRQV